MPRKTSSALWMTFATAFVAIVLSNGHNSLANEVKDLSHVGTVEGKSYFAEMKQRRTWNEAQAYCQAAEMRLASIETPGQLWFLVGRLHRINYVCWLGGRTPGNWYFMDPLLLKWIHNDETLNRESVPRIYANPDCLYIGFWDWDPNPGYEYYSGNCYDTYLTLCELVIG